ncbi:MAG: S41 family peptidase [Acidobacteriota bacterium]
MSRLLTSAVLVLLAALPRPALAQTEPRVCTTVTKNLYVRDALFRYYLWYQFLPDVDPARYASPEAYLEAVRYRELDSRYSYVTDRAASEAFFSDSQFIGFGFSTQTIDLEMRVLQVFDDSPAAEAGLARGDRLLEVNGRSVAELIASGQIGGVFGPSEEGVRRSVVVETREGERRELEMVKRIVTIPTVSLTRVFEVDGRTVGYIFFRNFVRPSFDALDEAFAALREAGVTELVLDLRYNGGGLVDVAVHLGSLIGGSVNEGRVFAEYRHNDRNTHLDKALRFTRPEAALNLERLVVIASGASASASELVVNALRPYMPVTLIGDTTYGKPVGQYGLAFCDKVVAPVSFVLVNADGDADYFEGLRADCPAPDDLDHDLGDSREGSLAEALTFIRTGACTAPPASEPQRLRATERPRRETGWQSVVNAH